MPWQLSVIRAALRLLPPPVRVRWAARLFLKARRHPEPAREAMWRERGVACDVGGMAGVRFGDGVRTAWLLHGWEGRGLQLSAFTEPLVAAGWTVVALDGPGHGRTPGRAGFVPFAHHLGLGLKEAAPDAIIAHSMGGAAVLIAADRAGFQGAIACLGGPPETAHIAGRAMDVLGVDRRLEARFMTHARRPFAAYDLDGVLDTQGRAASWSGRVHAWLADGDDDIPVDESRAIVAAAGGGCTVVSGVGHRSIMWHAPTVAEVVAFVDA